MAFRDDYMDLNKELTFDNQVIFISGTPCTGKTTIATELNDYLINNGCDSTLIKINDLAVEKDLVLGEDPDKYYKVIDIDRLNDVLKDEIAEFKSECSSIPKALVVEGHLSHLCEGADKMVVLRLNPSFELYDEELNEIDTTDKSIDDVLSVILDVINDNAHYPAGSIDFMDWFLS